MESPRSVLRFLLVWIGFDIDIDIEAEEREDRISQLPDDVVCYIVSELSTRAAVRTSILSRRWRHVYTLINQVRFHLHHGSYCHPTLTRKEEIQRKFAQGVDTFLQHHSGFKVTSFELVCCFRGCILDTFRKWMNSVGTLGVEQLTIGFCSINYLLDHPVNFFY
ncbi:F-box/LRR-repeat protein At3g03030-like [Primulina eburnea]|uniref:F-box/LRR-repeat protein At3g03030-like n=1 Tax=Primulina eburnea TaxID=1245227 RepID=UPI003C6BDE67